jgi:hypothetical protein
MNSRNTILSGALLALVAIVSMNMFTVTGVKAYTQPASWIPSAGLGIWEVKNDIQICNTGSSTPQGPTYEIGGCVDLKPDKYTENSVSGNQTFVRSGSYLFTGEQLEILAVVRDFNGPTVLPQTATLMIDGVPKVQCPIYSDASISSWFGHDVTELLEQLPPQEGSIGPGFNAGTPSQPTLVTDQLYSCSYTVTPADVDLAGKVSVSITDISGNTAATLPDVWAFNPPISASVSFSSGTSLTFPSVQPGTTTLSSNSMLIKNTALGGVDLAVFLTGNDLIDTSGTAMCPTSNVLNVNNIGYRCNVGSYDSEQWTPLPHLKEANTCGDAYAYNGETWVHTPGALSETVKSDDIVGSQCLVEDGWTQSNLLIPDLGSFVSDSVLGSGQQAQCNFQLNAPFPCFGTYSASNAVDVLIRAV